MHVISDVHRLTSSRHAYDARFLRPSLHSHAFERLPSYDLISSITTNIFIRRPKHRDGDVPLGNDIIDPGLTPVTCQSLNLRCCYISTLGTGRWRGECRPLIVASCSPTTQRVMHTCIVTWLPLCCPTLSAR